MEDGTTPWETVSGEKFKGQLFPFGVLVVYMPSPTRHTYETRKWDPKGRLGIFAGYVNRSPFEWGQAYAVWDLANFLHSDLRLCATYRNQRLGEPQIVRQCYMRLDDETGRDKLVFLPITNGLSPH